MKQTLLGILGKINSFISHLIRLGLKDGVNVYFFNSHRDGLLSLKIKSVKTPIFVRGNTSDFSVFDQIFYAKDYDIALDFTPENIVDCGANIGLASLFFKNKYPLAHIVAVEPEDSNFELVKKNTDGYSSIDYENAGIWHHDSFLAVSPGPTGAHWDFIVNEVGENTPGAIRGISIPYIMEKYGFAEISILKIDIEGAEKELFASDYEKWLPNVKVLLIELHDRMKPGCGQSFFKAISQYDFDFLHSGENIIAVRRDTLK